MKRGAPLKAYSLDVMGRPKNWMIGAQVARVGQADLLICFNQ